MFTNKSASGHNNTCGKKISECRKAMGKSQRELADALQLAGLDIDKNAVQRIEAGKRFVTDIELTYFTKVLHVTLEALLADGLQETHRACCKLLRSFLESPYPSARSLQTYGHTSSLHSLSQWLIAFLA